MSAHYPALLVVCPLAAAMLSPVIAMRSTALMRFVCAVALTTVFGFSLSLLVDAIASGPIHYHFGGWTPPFGIEFVIDPLSGLMAVLVTFFSLLSLPGLAHDTAKMKGLRCL